MTTTDSIIKMKREAGVCP